VKAIQQVIRNLLISEMDIRSEEDIDVRQYTHSRKTQVIKVCVCA